MIPAIKSELRKVFTVRSTYVILALVLGLEIFFAFYTSGWHISSPDLHNPDTLSNDVTAAVGAVSVFAALIALLLFTHEYRYNTIMYTLTLTNSRHKMLLAKIVAVTGLSIIFTLIVGLLSPLMSVLGAHLHHLHFAPQTIHFGDILWRSLFYGWGYAMAGLLLAALIRNQIGAIVALLIAPTTIESLLGLLLKNNVVYLPFSALSNVIGQGMDRHPGAIISPARTALVFGAYLLTGWIVAWVLFLRRDTN